MLFCFFLFPVFLFYVSLNIVLESRVDNVRQSKIKEMDNSLEYLNKYSNNKKYIHYLLSKISDYSQKQDNPKEYLKNNINNLKSKYPNKFQFVVWNENGKVINDLTDKSGYSYVLNKIYENLYEVNNALKRDSSIRIASLKTIKKNLKLLQTFFGRIFITENLKKPLINDVDSGPFLTELGHDFSYVWFSIKPKISFLCFISESFLNDYSGLNKIVNSLNSNNSDIIYGYSEIPNYDNPLSGFPVKYSSSLSIALATFENAGNDVFENDESIVRVSMPQSNIRVFGFYPKDDVWNLDYQKKYWFTLFIALLFFFYSFISFWYLIKHNFFSIRWKLTILFLLANLAPISILSFVTKFYIDNKRISLKKQIISNIEKSMRGIDTQYNNLILEYSNNINIITDEISEKLKKEEVKEKEIKELVSLYNKYEASAIFFIASDSQILLDKHDDKSLMSLDFVSSIGGGILKILNNKQEVKTDNTNALKNFYTPSNPGFVRIVMKNLGRLAKIYIGERTKIYYWRSFGDKEKFNHNYFLMIAWDLDTFQNICLKSYFKNKFKKRKGFDYFIKSNLSNYSYGSKKYENVLYSILEKNPGVYDNITGDIVIDNRKYIFAYLTGVNFKDWSILSVYPEEEIDKEINLLLVQILAVAFISLLFTMIIGHLLSIQFLSPINNLGVATLAIGERNFSHRIPIGDKDEFGYLNQMFNRVIEGLGDFEVAKIVQESLFPGNRFSVGNFDIFGRSVVMTTLGGDYYDCFKINDEYQGIIIGDVAGHGIPSGLMMAMAKSSVLSAPEEIKLDPTLLTTRLHKMFFAIKNERLKRMMTFQYFVLNVKTGHFIYTNAGHCFPYIVNNETKTASFLEYIATPLGIGPRCRCKNYEFDLKVGDSLILYTDGIVEANNEAGEQYGYDRFKISLPEHYDSNPETYYYNLYNKVYKTWSHRPDDDLTIIIVNRN